MPGIRAGRRIRERSAYFDYSMLAVVIILICFGLVMLYSASAYEAASDAAIGDDMFYFRRQAVNSLIALGAALVVSFVDYHAAVFLSPVIYAVSMGLMAAVRFTPFGRTVNGATRWLQYGSYSFQPSEIAKIAVILIMPLLILKMGKRIREFRNVVLLFIIGLIPALGAYLFTDNLSTALIILAICVVMIYLAHPKTGPFIAGLFILGGGVTGLLILINRTFSSSSNFRVRRILAWLQPEKNLSSGGYQVMQALYAIGSGGFFGKGLGNSTQKLSTIPEAQNDMIFSIICEELGLFGAILVLLLFGYLLYRLYYIAKNAADTCGTLVVSGIFIHISLQVILNICVNLNLIPTTGVTLPFLSYGGTSVIFTMLEIGIALNVAKGIRPEPKTDPALLDLDEDFEF